MKDVQDMFPLQLLLGGCPDKVEAHSRHVKQKEKDLGLCYLQRICQDSANSSGSINCDIGVILRRRAGGLISEMGDGNGELSPKELFGLAE